MRFPVLMFVMFLLLCSGCSRKETSVTSLKMLEGGKTFAVPTGTVADQSVLRKFPDARIKYYNTVIDCALAVRDGKADAASYDLPVLKNITARYDGITVLPELLFDDKYGFAVRLEDTELKKAGDEVLAELKKDGTYDGMMERWFPGKGNPGPMPVIPPGGKNGVLKFGTAAVTEPMSYHGEDRTIIGFDIEFASRIAAKLDKTLEIVDMEFGAMIPALISGKVDMIGAGLSITEERAKKVLFTESYYPSGIAALVKSPPAPARKASKHPFSSEEDIKDKRIGILLGSVHDTYARKNYPDARLFEFQAVPDIALAIETGKIDAAIFCDASLTKILQNYDDIGVLQSGIISNPVGAGFSKGNTELRDRFNAFLEEIKGNGILNDMTERWVKQQGTEMPAIAGSDKNGILKVGIDKNMGMMPFAFVHNGNLAGLDIELAQRFAAYTGKAFVPVDLVLTSMLAALKTGKIDIAVCSMTITAERKKEIDFSDPYYLSGSSIAALKQNIGKPAKLKFAKEEDVRDKRIGVLLGSVGDHYAKLNYPDAKLFEFQTVPDLTLSMVSDKIDAAIFNNASLTEILRNYDEIGILQRDIIKNPIGTGFNKNNPDLRAQFNTFLAEIKSNGILADMEDRWVKKLSLEMPPITGSDKNGVLKVGIDKNMGMPFAFVHNGNLAGMDIELAERFAAWLGKSLEPVDLVFSSMLAALKTNKIDMAACCMTITEERQKEIDFSDIYCTTGTSIIALKKNIEKSNKLRSGQTGDIEDKKIGVLMGSIQDMFAKRDFPDAEVLQYQNVTDMLTAVKTNKVDVGFADQVGLQEIFDKNPELGLFAGNLYTVPIAAAFNENNDALREKFNAFLKEIRANGVYDNMVSRWMDKRETTMPEIANSGTNGTLRNGIVSDSGLPFTILQNGELAGFDIELSMRFAAYLGMKYEPVDIPFGSMIASIATNKIDFTTCSMMITEEREKQVDFSDPYYESGVSLFALKENISEPESLKLTKLDDIADKRVGIFSGTVHDAFMAEHYPKAQVFRFDGTADMMLSLKTGKIDAAMFDLITAGLILKRNPDLALLSDDVFSMPLGVGFNKKDRALREEFNRYLKEIRADGTYDAMCKRWFIDDAEAAVMPPFTNPASGKKLTVGVSTEDLPYVAYMNNDFVGFDIEMIRTFAQRANYNLEFINIDFPGLIAALVSGKVDMISDGIGISKERAKQIDFSDSYANFETAVVAAKKDMPGFRDTAPEVNKKSFLKKVAESFHNNIILEKRYLLILDGLKLTILITIFSAIAGTILGGLVCFMRMSKQKLLSSSAKGYISLLRGTPVLVLLMIIYYVVFASVNINPSVVAVLAFGLNFGAYVSEMFRTSIESVDKGQQEAGIASGFTKLQTFVHIILPQALRRVLPVYKGEFISLLKMTSIVGYIAVQDLTKASDIIRSRTFDAFFPLIMAAVLYLVLAWLLSWGLSRIEISVDPKRRHFSIAKKSGK